MVFKNVDLDLVDWRLELDDTKDIFRIVDLMADKKWELTKDDMFHIFNMTTPEFLEQCEKVFGKQEEEDELELTAIQAKLNGEFYEEITDEETKKEWREIDGEDEFRYEKEGV